MLPIHNAQLHRVNVYKSIQLTVTLGKITALAHEIGDDAVEGGPFEVQRRSGTADPFLTGAKSTEIFSSFRGHISTQLQEKYIFKFNNDPWTERSGNILPM
jgi:hypothetical protein